LVAAFSSLPDPEAAAHENARESASTRDEKQCGKLP
jgi:hypothetical protein